MIRMSPPNGALGNRLGRAMIAQDNVQSELFAVRMADVARIVRDALPDAIGLVIDCTDLYVPPIGVVLHSIYTDGGRELWVRGQELPEALTAYRTSEGTAWPDVVRHLEHELTDAMGAEEPGMWWEPAGDRYRTADVYHAHLPSAEDVAAFQADTPQHLAAYLADRDARPFAGIWHSQPVAHPTMSVAGVAITASIEADGTFTVDIDPTATPPTVMPPAGPGTPVRVRISGRDVDAGPDPTASAGQDSDEDEEPATCPTEGCEEDPNDGEGWDGYCGNCADRRYAKEMRDTEGNDEAPEPGADSQPIAVSDTVPICLAPTPDVPISSIGGLEEFQDFYDGDGEMRYHAAPADVTHDNGRRAGFAITGLVAYARRTGLLSRGNDEDPETAFGDLLADLRHLADALGVDYDEIDEHGQVHYEAELRGEI